MFDESTPVEVSFEGTTRRKRVRADPKVLLLEFVERFDRRFLPMAVFELR